MRYTLPLWLLWLAVTRAISSCGNKGFQTPERSAMSPFPVPLFDGAASITTNTSFKSLRAGTLVYTTDDTLTVNDNKFLKVVWGDSSAYAPVNTLLPQGRQVIITAPYKDSGISVYSDPDVTTEIFQFPYDWMMAVVGPNQERVTTIMYREWEGPSKIGYIPITSISVDPLDLEFFKKYYKALDLSQKQNANAPLDELKGDIKYQALTAWKWRFGEVAEQSDDDTPSDVFSEDAPEDQGGSSFDLEAYENFTSSSPEWEALDDGTSVAESEIPGTISRYFVLEDGSEINANGLWLLNQYPDGENAPDGGKLVTEVRFVFTARKEVSLEVDVQVWDNDLNFARTVKEDQVNLIEPGDSYSISLKIEPGAINLCSPIRMTIRTPRCTRSSVVPAECGD